MKRFITNDDLTVLVTKASTLRKLAKSAQKIHADLAVEEGYVTTAEKSIGRGQPGRRQFPPQALGLGFAVDGDCGSDGCGPA